MSYVICSNVENDDTVLLGGNNDPASFLNNFKSPLILDKDTEVAVESVKIDRQDKWDIKDSDVFYLYWGPEQRAGVLESGGVTKNGVRIELRRGAYTVKGMALELARAVNNSPISPSIFGKCEVETQEENGKFNGFEFKFTPWTKGADRSASITVENVISNNWATIAHNTSATLATADPSAPNASLGGYWDPATKILTCKKDQRGATPFDTSNKSMMYSECAYRMIDYPLSNAGGRAVFSLAETNQLRDPFQVGLVRPTNVWVDNGFPALAPVARTEINEGNVLTTFMDFSAVWDNVADNLRLYFWANQFNSGGTVWILKEIKYWEAPGAVYTAPINNTTIASSAITDIIFELQGDELEVKVKDNTATGETALIKSASYTAKTQYNFPPIANATEALLPAISLSASGQECKLDEWNANVLPNWKQSGTSGQVQWRKLTGSNELWKSYTPRPGNTLVAGSDWYSNAVNTRNRADELLYNQSRPSLNWYGKTANTNVFTYTRPNASGVIDYVPILVVGAEPRDTTISDYLQVLYVIPLPYNQANMSRELGFGRWSVIDYSTFKTAGANDGIRILASIEAGIYTVHSAFVRINDLPIQSYNGATSSRSNILYHIPRFSNNGKQFGELFFPVPEKTYIKLNNTDKIMLNQLKIDLVSRNERVVQDLTGATIVCLHFRKSK